jgi:hypothetical protein
MRIEPTQPVVNIQKEHRKRKDPERQTKLIEQRREMFQKTLVKKLKGNHIDYQA